MTVSFRGWNRQRVEEGATNWGGVLEGIVGRFTAKARRGGGFLGEEGSFLRR